MYIPISKNKKYFINTGLFIIFATILTIGAAYALDNKVNAEKKNCDAFKTQPNAQLYYNALINSSDPIAKKSAQLLDRDKDKIACEKLPKK